MCTEALTVQLCVCVCVFAAERDDPRPGRRGFLAGGPHPAGVQRRRAVLSGKPADSLHRLPQSGTCTLCIAAPITPAFRATRLKGAKAICLTFKVHKDDGPLLYPREESKASSLMLRIMCDGSNVIHGQTH